MYLVGILDKIDDISVATLTGKIMVQTSKKFAMI